MNRCDGGRAGGPLGGGAGGGGGGGGWKREYDSSLPLTEQFAFSRHGGWGWC